MSRHSKWSKVKQFKGAIDAKRSASFTKLAREITVATREKGADPDMNARLRAAIQKARDGSMPKENIERAIQRGVGGVGEGEQIESLMYEAYVPGGTALVIECLTDNRNRTASDVKHILSKHGGTLGASGAVTYLFDHVGSVHIAVELPKDRHEEIELAFIDAGVTDIIEGEGETEARSSLKDLAKVADAVTAVGLAFDAAGFVWVPKTLVEADEATGIKVVELIEALEENDDVSRVYSNMA